MITLDVAQLSDVGRKRQVNEDYCDFRIPPEGTAAALLGAVFIVADGIGGLGHGDVASRVATNTLLEYFYEKDPDSTEAGQVVKLRNAIRAASRAVREEANRSGMDNMGSTCAGVLLLPGEKNVAVFNVGDSRVYRVRSGNVEMLSVDQSADDHGSDKLTAFLGQRATVDPEIHTYDVQTGDVFWICSDGVWRYIPPTELMELVQQLPAEQATQEAIKRVLERGASDNATVSVVRMGPFKAPAQRRNPLPTIFMILVLLLIVAAAVWWFVLRPQSEPSGGANGTSGLATSQATEEDSAVLSTSVPADEAETDETEGSSGLLAVATQVPTDTSVPPTATPTTPPPSATHTETSTPTEPPPTATSTDLPTATDTSTPRPTRTPLPTRTPSRTPLPTQPEPTVTLDATAITATPQTVARAATTPRQVVLAEETTLYFVANAEAAPVFYAEVVLEPETGLQVLPGDRELVGPDDSALVAVRVLDGGQTGWLARSALEGAEQTATVTQSGGALLREGNNTRFPVVRSLSVDEVVTIIGISEIPPLWYAVEAENGDSGWVAPSAVEFNGDEDALPQIAPPPTLTPTPSNTPTVTPTPT